MPRVKFPEFCNVYHGSGGWKLEPDADGTSDIPVEHLAEVMARGFTMVPTPTPALPEPEPEKTTAEVVEEKPAEEKKEESGDEKPSA